MADNLTPKEEFLLNPVEEHNITDAAIASFETNFKHPVKVTVPITPQQDLHGMPYPYPAGASVNLIPDGTDTENGYVNNHFLSANGDENYNSGWYISEYFNVDAGEVYTLTVTSNTTAACCIYNENKDFVDGYVLDGSRKSVITMPENAAYARCTQRSGNGTTCCFMLVKGESSAAPTFENYRKYSNICPIEGRTATAINHTGANLLNGETAANILKTGKSSQVSLNEDEDGKYVRLMGMSGTDVNLTKTLKFKENTRYTVILTGKNESSGVSSTHIRFVYSDGNSTEIDWSDPTEIKTIAVASATNKTVKAITTLTRNYNTRIYYEKPFGIFEGVVSASSFEAHHGESFPISWKHAEGTYNFMPIQAGEGDPSPDNVRPISPALTLTRDDNSVLTVYGGSITFRDDGTSVVESEYNVYAPNENSDIRLTGSDQSQIVFRFYDSPTIKNRIDAFCTHFKLVANPSTIHVTAVDWYQNTCQLCIQYSDLNITTIEELKAWLTEQSNLNSPFQIIYKGTTSSIYILSKAETQRVIEALGDKVTTTVYGGTVTVNEDGSADVVSDKILLHVSDLTVYSQNPSKSNVAWQFQFLNRQINSKPGWSRDIISDTFKTIGSTPYYVNRNGIYVYLGVPVEDVNTGSELIAKYGNAVLIAPAQTAQTYHFPNVGQLKAFLGQNNVWSDIGNVNVKYLTQNSATGLEYRGDRALELRRRAMIGDAPTIHTTVGSEETGGLASFTSYIKASVKKIEIPFGPKQDLHGYDHPWPAGGGKNLWNLEMEAGGISAGGSDNTETNRFRSKGYFKFEQNTQYVFSLKSGTPTQCLVKYYDENYHYVGETGWMGNKLWSFTTPDNATYLRVVFYSSSEVIQEVQLELGSTATAYEPYENICPIEGHDGCEITGCRRNLFDNITNRELFDTNIGSKENLIEAIKQGQMLFRGIAANSVGITSYTSQNQEWVIFPIVPGKSYTTYRFVKQSAQLLDSDFNTVRVANLISTGHGKFGNNYVSFTAQSGEKYMALYVFNRAQGTEVQQWTLNDIVDEFMIVNGLEHPESYTPYQATTIPLVFNQSGDHAFLPTQEGAGNPSPENVRPIHPGLTITRDDDSVLSVYDGTLTVNEDGTGELLENKKCVTVTNINNNNVTSSNYNASMSTTREFNLEFPFKFTAVNSMPGATGNYLSFTHSTFWNQITMVNKFGIPYSQGDTTSSHTALGIRIANEIIGVDGTETNAERTLKFNAYLTDNPAQILYPLEDPITYALSVTETNRALEALGLTQHIGPIYGGTVTINPDGSADVVSNLIMFDIGDYDWSGGYTVNDSYRGLFFRNFNYDMYNAVKLSDRYQTIRGLFGIHSNYSYAIGSNSSTSYHNALFIRDIECENMTRAEFKAYRTGVKIIISANAPQTYHFSNLEQLKVWLGENNFWCDISDDITVKYWNRG